MSCAIVGLSRCADVLTIFNLNDRMIRRLGRYSMLLPISIEAAAFPKV
jgi:hypothetical protein